MIDTNHSDDFVNGPWRGYYSYRNRENHRHWMRDVALTFSDGVITGEGLDGIGKYSISGHYDAKTGDCRWTERHANGHEVFCLGFREGMGVWGIFKTGTARGEFLVWPSGSHEYTNRPKIDEEPKPIEGLNFAVYKRDDS